MTDDELDYGALTSMEDGEIPKTYVNPNRTYKADGFYATIKLSELANSVLTEHDYEDGRPPQKGLFIPIRDAGLLLTPKKNVLLNVKIELSQLATQHHTHVISQMADRDTYAKWRSLGFNQGLIGFASPVGYKKKKR